MGSSISLATSWNVLTAEAQNPLDVDMDDIFHAKTYTVDKYSLGFLYTKSSHFRLKYNEHFHFDIAIFHF